MKRGRKKGSGIQGTPEQRLMRENKDYRNLSEQIRGKVIIYDKKPL